MTSDETKDTLYTPLNAKIANLRHSAITNISPMELENDEPTKKREQNLCLRCLRKKFICIVLLLLTVIALANIFNTFIGKLSENDVSTIYNFLKSTFSANTTALLNITIAK